MPKITTGSAKGRKLEIPPVPEIRVVKDKVKQSVFMILGEKVVGAVCLDLYAGSGNMGLEALSRGARHCDFVDESYLAVKTLTKNIEKCGFELVSEDFYIFNAEAMGESLEGTASIIQGDAVKFAANTPMKYDIIFADPFYHDRKHKFLFENFEEILTENGVVVFLHPADLDMEEQISNTKRMKIYTQRRFGTATATVLSL